MRQKCLESLNIERESILHRIYLTRTDVRTFMRCGWKKANDLFDACHQKCIDDGKINLEGRIYYKHLLELTGIKEADIHHMAKIERQVREEERK